MAQEGRMNHLQPQGALLEQPSGLGLSWVLVSLIQASRVWWIVLHLPAVSSDHRISGELS